MARPDIFCSKIRPFANEKEVHNGPLFHSHFSGSIQLEIFKGEHNGVHAGVALIAIK